MNRMCLITKYLFIFLLLPCFLFVTGTACKKQIKKVPSRLIINTFPENAKVFILGDERGKKLRVPPGVYILKFTHPGYKDTWMKADVGRGKTVEVNCRMEKEVADVMIKSVPDKVQVEFNGKKMGLTPVVIQDLPHGEYSATLSTPGYSPKTVQWKIDSASPQLVRTTLASNMGTFAVDTTPSGAEVFLNGRSLGQTPLKEEVQAGNYTLVLRKKDYLPLTREIVLSRSRTYNMGKLSMQIRRGSIRITSNPSGAKIMMNGREYGSTPYVFKDLLPGTYTIRIAKKGFDANNLTVRLYPGAQLRENVVLENNRCGADVVTQPANLTVYLNGKYLGVTAPDPANNRYSKTFAIRNLPVGKHVLTVFHKRGVPQKKNYSFETKKGEIIRLANIKLWVPNARITYNNNNLAQDVRIVQTLPDGSIYVTLGQGIGTMVKKHLIKKIEYLKEEK